MGEARTNGSHGSGFLGPLANQIRSTHRRFRLAELVCFDHGADAHVIDTALRNFFDAHHPSPPADKCMGAFFPGRHNRKSDFHSYNQPLANPEVKAVSRNIACPSKDWLELPEVGLEPDFDLEGQFVATSCPTFSQFSWPNGFTNSCQPLTLRSQPRSGCKFYVQSKMPVILSLAAPPFAPLAVLTDSASVCGLRSCLRQ